MSDTEYGHGIRRAESCDSVASDSSVLEMQPDMPKIGQLEFALEYDRYIRTLCILQSTGHTPYKNSLIELVGTEYVIRIDACALNECVLCYRFDVNVIHAFALSALFSLSKQIDLLGSMVF